MFRLVNVSRSWVPEIGWDTVVGAWLASPAMAFFSSISVFQMIAAWVLSVNSKPITYDRNNVTEAK